MAWLGYGGVLLLLIAVIAGGYGAFRAFAVTPDPGIFNLNFLAVVAGVASFFSPCAFPLLPGYLSVVHLADRGDGPSLARRGRALASGASAAFGVTTFNLFLGLAIALLGAGVAESLSISGSEPSQLVRGFRGLVGVVLVILGLGQRSGWNLKPAFLEGFIYRSRPSSRDSRGRLASMYLYGLGYNAAGMGCTGPILAGLMVYALASGGFGPAMAAFGIFSVTMGSLMIIISILLAAPRQTLVRRMKVATPQIKKVASYLLVLVGLFNLYTAINLDLFLRLFFP